MTDMISRLLTDLAACLCAQIQEDGLPEPCFCGVMPGARVAYDYVNGCEEQDGMAWTRLTLAYPAGGVGRVDSSIRNCNTGLGVDIEIGILRRAPTLDENRNPPDEASQLGSTDLQTADMLAMFKAIQCCFAESDRDYIIGAYRPFGPEGFAVGGTLPIMVAL